MSTYTALTVVSLLAAVGIAVDAAEMTASRAGIATGFDWRVIRTVHRWAMVRPRAASVFERLTDPSRWALFHASRAGAAIAACVAFAAGSPALGAALAVVVVLGQLVVSARFAYGLDGADQMQTMVWMGLAIAGLSPAAGLTLVAGQSLLSYVVAGIAKVSGDEWRSGVAPARVLATASHGSRGAANVAARASSPLAWATIAFEVVGPVLALTSPPAAVVFAACAVAFHVSIAVAMGLNNFVWGFTAALAALLWAVPKLHAAL